VAVLGTGEQALLQVTWLRKLRPINRVHVWGRRPEAAARLCEAFQAEGIDARPDALEAGAPCVITTTAARSPLPLEAFRNAIHVTGIGTDMPGKHELPVELFANALIVTDDHTQCLHHGDFGNAVRAHVIHPDADLAVGTILAEHPEYPEHRTVGSVGRNRRSIADLTGVGATDAAVASVVVGNRFSTVVE
ncbi:MAG: hypothetical protein QOH84_5652, partial [Kribbellaceae bacterium]|nr:hypothetical protein [Kribbellaceae bacterium]